jgi:hypothetical protein
MSIISILIILISLAVAYFIYKRAKGFGLKRANESTNDPMSQELYNAKKHPKDEEISLTMEERVQLSWQFLTNITEQILNKFTSDDRNKVHSAGEKLNKHGMSYKHDVNQEVKVTIDAVKSRTKNKTKNVGMSR